MGFIKRLFGLETRGTTTTPSQILDAAGYYNNETGIAVGVNNAMTSDVVYGCLRVLAYTYGSLPCFLYRRTNEGREKAPLHPLFTLLHSTPNSYQTPFTYWSASILDILKYGNHYSLIVKDQQRPVGLLPLDPRNTRGYWKDGKLLYRSYQDKKPVDFYADEVFHVAGMIGPDGVNGLSPIEEQAQTIGLNLAADKYAAKFFSQGFHVGKYFTTPTNVPREYAELLKEQIHKYQGLNAAHGTPVFQYGIEPRTMSLPPEQMQFVATKGLTEKAICRIFGVPPHKIGVLDRATWSNIEHQQMEFVNDTLRPFAVRYEQEINRKLLWENEKAEYYAEFNLTAYLRGDVTSRYTAYHQGIQDGWLTRQEVRRLENLNDLPGLEQPLQPMNMQPVGEEQEQKATLSFHRVITSTAERTVTKEVLAIKRAFKKYVKDSEDLDAFEQWVTEFYTRHQETLRETLSPVVLYYAEQAGKPADEILDRVVIATKADSAKSLRLAAKAGKIEDLLADWQANKAKTITHEVLA